jgi:hypothetical protein
MGVVGALTEMGQKTASEVAPDQGPERRDEGDTNAFLLSVHAIRLPRGFRCSNVVTATGRLVTNYDHAGRVISLNYLYTIYGHLRISLMHLRRRAPGT